MRQRVKRRLFMMGMALAAGTAGPAFAKGGGKAGDGPHLQPWQGMGSNLAALHLDSGEARNADRNWRLELLPPETRSHFDRDTRPQESRRFGLALRRAF